MYGFLVEQFFLADKPQHFLQPSIPPASFSLWIYLGILTSILFMSMMFLRLPKKIVLPRFP